MLSQTPTYNLMVVLKETGLKADVLRAWERRYDLPHPQRSPGGHRLYSEYDIAVVKWLKNRQAEGVSISRAVSQWKELVAAGRDPLAESPVAKTTASPAFPAVAGTSLELLRQRWVEGCLAYDSLQADSALYQAFALYPVENVCDAILRQGLKDIGEQWYLGQVSPQQEHFASNMAVRRIHTLLHAASQPTRSETILVGCPPGERHTFPALLLCLFLQRRGFKVVYLGADIPCRQMEDAIRSIRPSLVVLSAQQLVTAASLAAMAHALREQNIPLAYGGLVFNRLPELRERIAAVFLGQSLEEAPEKIETLLQEPASFPHPIVSENPYRAQAMLFQQARPLIEHSLSETLQEKRLEVEPLESVNAFIGDGLAAALALGDPTFLESDLDWAAGLITNREKGNLLLPYLAAYSHCIAIEMGQTSITGWMDQYVSRNQATRK